MFFALPYATYLPYPLKLFIFRWEHTEVACAVDKDKNVPEVHVWQKALSKERGSNVSEEAGTVRAQCLTVEVHLDLHHGPSIRSDRKTIA